MQNLLKIIASHIRAGGPITISKYMQIVLTNTNSGYYMKSDVFGKSGDFITSPEISQLFGEMISVWCVNEWMQIGSPKKFKIIELGPGRGTLAHDLLRSFSKFPIMDAISYHLVEVSPFLEEMQRQKFGLASDSNISSKYSVEMNWHKSLKEVPAGCPSFIYANEFFDALPVHKFQKVGNKWREIFIDFDGEKLKYILHPSSSLTASLFEKYLNECTLDHAELSLDVLVFVEEISKRIKLDGGFSLISDYGHMGEKGDTFRAFKNHSLHDPLVEPGSADLTADVNFKHLKEEAIKNAAVFGPISQHDFLKQLGIDVRLKMLLTKSTEKESENLISGYKMLMKEMGQRFKFFAMKRKQDCGNYIPPGF